MLLLNLIVVHLNEQRLGLLKLLLLGKLPFLERYITALVVARIEEIVVDVDVKESVDSGQSYVLHRWNLALEEHLERDLKQLAGVFLELAIFEAIYIA